MKLGDPLDEDTDISVHIIENASSRLRPWLKEVMDAGETIHSGGSIENHILRPTVITGVSADASLRCEETFASIITINTFSNWEELMQLANRSKCGLHAGVFARHIERSNRKRRCPDQSATDIPLGSHAIWRILK